MASRARRRAHENDIDGLARCGHGAHRTSNRVPHSTGGWVSRVRCKETHEILMNSGQDKKAGWRAEGVRSEQEMAGAGYIRRTTRQGCEAVYACAQCVTGVPILSAANSRGISRNCAL
eukprot:9500153-Pyramimonas_sp.AAC.1